jgi:hypothetical protein
MEGMVGQGGWPDLTGIKEKFGKVGRYLFFSQSSVRASGTDVLSANESNTMTLSDTQHTQSRRIS